MNILVVLIPVALALGLIGLAVFFWTVHTGQYDDLAGDAERILFDDDKPLTPVRDGSRMTATKDRTPS